MNMFDQMDINEANEAKAKEMYLAGIMDAEKIARILDCPEQHVLNWIKNGKWDQLEEFRQQEKNQHRPSSPQSSSHTASPRNHASPLQDTLQNIDQVNPGEIKKKLFKKDCLIIYLSFGLAFLGFYINAEVYDFDPNFIGIALCMLGYFTFLGYSAYAFHRVHGWAGSIGAIVMLFFFFPLLFTIPFRLKKTRSEYLVFENLTGINDLDKLMSLLDYKSSKYGRKYLRQLISLQSYCREDLPKNINSKTIFYNEIRSAIKFLDNQNPSTQFPPRTYLGNAVAYAACSVYIHAKRGTEVYPAKDLDWFYNIAIDYSCSDYTEKLKNMIRNENPEWVID